MVKSESSEAGNPVRVRGWERAGGPFLVMVVITALVLGMMVRPEGVQGRQGLPWLVGALVLLAITWWRGLKVLSRHARGAEGVERVAAMLSGLPSEWTVAHAIPVKGGDVVDHVVLGPAGLCAVETIRWTGRIELREGRLLDGGRAYAGYTLSALKTRTRHLAESLGAENLPCYTLVAVAGGRLAQASGEAEGLWVGDAEELTTWIESLPAATDQDDTLTAVRQQLGDMTHGH